MSETKRKLQRKQAVIEFKLKREEQLRQSGKSEKIMFANIPPEEKKDNNNPYNYTPSTSHYFIQHDNAQVFHLGTTSATRLPIELT